MEALDLSAGTSDCVQATPPHVAWRRLCDSGRPRCLRDAPAGGQRREENLNHRIHDTHMKAHISE